MFRYTIPLGGGMAPGGAAGAAASFSPADLSPALWLEADDTSTLFQNNDGSTPIADGQSIGYWHDKSANNYDMVSLANDSTRPTWTDNGGASYATFNGSSQLLVRLADLGMYNAGACSVFAAVRGTPLQDARLECEASGSTNQPLYALIQAVAGAANNLGVFIRNDAGATESQATLQASVWNTGTDKVVGTIDTGSALTAWVDGVEGSASAYTRSGVHTSDRFAIGAVYRTTAVAYFNCPRLYALVVVKRALTDQEASDLSTYLAAKMSA